MIECLAMTSKEQSVMNEWMYECLAMTSKEQMTKIVFLYWTDEWMYSNDQKGTNANNNISVMMNEWMNV